MSASAALTETLGLIRACHLFAKNYRKAAPPLSGDDRAIETAFLRVEELLIGGMRSAIDDLYVPRDPMREQFIKDEIARLEREDWNDQRRAPVFAPDLTR
jgi:hypothetical protein